MNDPFIESFRDGYLLLFDEINLDSKEVFQSVEESLENRILIIEIPLQEIKAPSILYMN